MMLNKESHTPLLIQLKDEIEKQINEGVYTDQIPSEREIMQQYDVSRSTVREAINSLVREGILIKKHGKGTYVSIKPLDRWLGHLSSTTDVIKSLGKKPGAEVIQFIKTQPPEHIQTLAGFKEAYFLKRLRLADDEPIGIEHQYYPLYIGEQLSDYNLDEITLYDVIQSELGIPFSIAKQKISSGSVTKEDLRRLGLSQEKATAVGILKAERMIKDQNENVIEYEEAFYRGDMYAFEINLARKFG